jgi:hypothetical protein
MVPVNNKLLDRLGHRPTGGPEHNPHLRVVVTAVVPDDAERDERKRPERIVGEVEAATSQYASWAAGAFAYLYPEVEGYRVKVLPGGAR